MHKQLATKLGSTSQERPCNGDNGASSGEAVYLCDELLEDPQSRKVHFLGVFNAIRSPQGFPFHLAQLCVVVQLVGGVGDIPVHVEIVHADTDEVTYAFPQQYLKFASRQSTVTACFRVRNCTFMQAGVYIVELYSEDTFIDDRTLVVLAPEKEDS